MRRAGVLVAWVAMVLGAGNCVAAEPTDMPTPAAAHAGPACGCAGGGECKSGCQKLWDWATYRPLDKTTCSCCPRKQTACYPPLYTFFPCQGSTCAAGATGHTCASSCGDHLSCYGRVKGFFSCRIHGAPCAASPEADTVH